MDNIEKRSLVENPYYICDKLYLLNVQIKIYAYKCKH